MLVLNFIIIDLNNLNDDGFLWISHLLTEKKQVTQSKYGNT